MAFATKLGSLIEELVEALTNISTKNGPKKFKKCHDTTLKNLKSHPFLRTNQFEIENTLDGLEERFYINDRESLALALNERREALKAVPSDVHPEILSLLIELSDQPTYKSKISDLDALRPPDEDSQNPLSWKDIAKEDGWYQDASLWKSIKYTDSSDDELGYEDSDDQSDESAWSAAGDDENIGIKAEDYMTKAQNVTLFNSIRKAQEWRTERPQTDSSGQIRKIAIDETQVIRETLFMLSGLKTTLYEYDARNAVVSAYQMSHVAWETHKAALNSFAESGRQLNVIRIFIQEPLVAPHMQAFQNAAATRLRDFDGKLSGIHARLASPGIDTVVTLINTRSELAPWLERLHELSDILFSIDRDANRDSPFRYLELLFEKATVAQLSNMTSVYEFISRIFVECFAVYLRPIRLWMDEGKLLPDDEIFFVRETSKDVSLSHVWKNRFKLRTSVDGKLHAPDFLHPAVNKIMNAGKNIVVLARLGHHHHVLSNTQREEPRLDYETICAPGLDLAPFPHLFATAFERWIQSKYRATSTTLKDALFDQHGLQSSLYALQRLYFMSDGSAALSFCQDLFERMDSSLPNWHDRYALTAIAHEAYEGLVNLNYLSVQMDRRQDHQISTTAPSESSVRAVLPHLHLIYRLTWPIQIIISAKAMEDYRSVFSLLLQLQRSAHMLRQTKILSLWSTDDEHWDERAPYYSCRTSLLWFCTTVQTYLSTLVLTPNIAILEQQMKEAHDLDSIISVHDDFVKRVTDEACLGSKLNSIRESMLDVLDLAIKLQQQQKGRRDSRSGFLLGVKESFGKHLRFICSGLRGIARTSSDTRSVKWNTLAEMLQMGSFE